MGAGVATPQKTALGRPVIAKLMPTRIPWTIAVTPVPMSVEMVTSWKRCCSLSAFRAEKGM